MIKNEKQYKISKAAANKFFMAIQETKKEKNTDVHPLLIKAQLDALKSTYDELLEEIIEYEKLTQATNKTFYVNSLDELAKTLIKARIVQNLSQKQLAEKLGLKEQQIQRYEANDYKSASLGRLKEISSALNVIIDSKVLVNPSVNLSEVVDNLNNIGYPKNFITKTLFSPELQEQLAYGEVESKNYSSIAQINFLSRFLKTNIDPSVGSGHTFLQNRYQGIQYKIPKRTNYERLNAESYFAISICEYISEIYDFHDSSKVLISAKDFRNNVISQFGQITFESTLKYIWTLGVPIIPLRKLNSFHGACVRIDVKNFIVLSHNTDLESRLLYDLLHEFRHSSQKIENKNMLIFEEIENQEGLHSNEEEIDANTFAADVLLDSRAEELTDVAVAQARGNLRYLKSVVPQIAQSHNVSTSALANYLAFRLSLQNENWWGAAHNLQEENKSCWVDAINNFFNNIKFNRLEGNVRELFIRTINYENAQ